jgi:hypothetical protein
MIVKQYIRYENVNKSDPKQLFSGNNFIPIPIKPQKFKITINYKTMKNLKNSVNSDKNFDQLISELSENEILNIQAMICVKGGGTDGNGSEPIIITKF